MNRSHSFFLLIVFSCSSALGMSEKTISLCFKNDTEHTALIHRSYLPRGKSVIVEVPTSCSFDITVANWLPSMGFLSCRFFDRNEHYRRITAPIELSLLTGCNSGGLVIAKNGTIFEVSHSKELKR